MAVFGAVAGYPSSIGVPVFCGAGLPPVDAMPRCSDFNEPYTTVSLARAAMAASSSSVTVASEVLVFYAADIPPVDAMPRCSDFNEPYTTVSLARAAMAASSS